MTSAPTAAVGAGTDVLSAPVATGQSPRQVVWTRNKTTLYRYDSPAERVRSVPVVLVYALINQPYVFDLTLGNSFVRHLLENGHDVFLVDWGTPGWEDRNVSLDELVGEHLPRAVDAALRAAGAEQYTLFGYCMGGTMATIEAARRPERVRNLVALTTPIDFADGGTFSVWAQRRHLDPESAAAGFGNIPSDVINFGSKMLKPVTNFVSAQSTMMDRLLAGADLTSWRAIDKWVNDGVPFPGAAFAQWIDFFYQRNLLVAGDLTIAGAPVDLGSIDASVLTIAGSRDHIVPPSMAQPLDQMTSASDHRYLELDAGHVGLLVGSGARTGLWPLITNWLDGRSS